VGRARGPDEATVEAGILERSRERPLVVLFGSDVLPLCRRFERALEREVRRRPQAVDFARVEVDRERAVANHFRVGLIPAVKAFRDGRLVAGFVGVRPQAAIARFLDSLVGPGDARGLLDELRAEQEWPDVVAALDELHYEEAFELLLARLRRGGSAERERIRCLMVSLFGELGQDHPLCERYRRRLAAALY
jgi:putative thioredoxin